MPILKLIIKILPYKFANIRKVAIGFAVISRNQFVSLTLFSSLAFLVSSIEIRRDK